MTSEHFHHVLRVYGELFWPTFTEYDNCVFRATGFEQDNYRAFQKSTGGNRVAIEATMNHVHVLDVLKPTVEEPSRELVIAFGTLLRDMWETKLRRDFPTRRFSVEFPTEDLANLLDYQATFFQLPEAAGQ